MNEFIEWLKQLDNLSDEYIDINVDYCEKMKKDKDLYYYMNF